MQKVLYYRNPHNCPTFSCKIDLVTILTSKWIFNQKVPLKYSLITSLTCPKDHEGTCFTFGSLLQFKCYTTNKHNYYSSKIWNRQLTLWREVCQRFLLSVLQKKHTLFSSKPIIFFINPPLEENTKGNTTICLTTLTYTVITKKVRNWVSSFSESRTVQLMIRLSWYNLSMLKDVYGPIYYRRRKRPWQRGWIL